jgi:hypothetical protein
MSTTPSTARFLWQRLEPFHGLIYFVPEADQHYTALGLDAGMMGYFSSRAAAMGPVPAEVVIATFYNFEPGRIRTLVPQAWERTTAPALWDARMAAADAALTRIFGERLAQPDIAEAAGVLRSIIDACAPEGRALFAGHLAQEWPTEPHLALWLAITLLREFRGDGHIAALTVEGVSGIEALVIHGATGSVPMKVLQATRGWDDHSWATAVEKLQQRGWVGDNALTPTGQTHRNRVEQYTDELAAAPWSRLSEAQVTSLAALGKELSSTIVAAGTFPGRN